MSKLIKFRAWDTIPGIGYKMRSWEEIRKNSMQYFWDDRTFPDRVIMQYTGLKDKNGKEIYELDIVKCPVSPDADDYLILEAGKNDFVLRTISIPSVYQEGLPDDCEVVSNIYENPELVEK